jgi:hypothetical protein
LFARKKLVQRKRGTPPTPSYDRTAAEAWLELAAADIRDLKRRGVPVEAAIDRVARERKLDPMTLNNYFRGRRASSRKMKKRR